MPAYETSGSKTLLFTTLCNYSLPNNNFSLVQIESICRQQIKCCGKNDTVFDRAENIVGKGERLVTRVKQVFRVGL